MIPRFLSRLLRITPCDPSVFTRFLRITLNDSKQRVVRGLKGGGLKDDPQRDSVKRHYTGVELLFSVSLHILTDDPRRDSVNKHCTGVEHVCSVSLSDFNG